MPSTGALPHAPGPGSSRSWSTSPGAFEGLFNLKYLNLGMCNIKDMPNLTQLVGLEELEMSGTTSGGQAWLFHGLTLLKLWVMNSESA